MKLLCHRGHWTKRENQNSLEAFERAISHGYGIETDIRDCDGELVISHDAPLKLGSVTLSDFLKKYSVSDVKPMLALNIKADGLHEKLKSALEAYGVVNYFVFDMSVPDTLGYMRLDMPFAVRLSEFEDGGQLLAKAKYVWLDAFESEWYSVELIEKLIAQGKNVAIVSPELHKRSHSALWMKLKNIHGMEQLYLCTDLINEAEVVFNVKTN